MCVSKCFVETSSNSPYIRNPSQVDTTPINAVENRILEDLVGKVDAVDVFEQSDTDVRAAIVAAKADVRGKVQNAAWFT